MHTIPVSVSRSYALSESFFCIFLFVPRHTDDVGYTHSVHLSKSLQ